MTEFLITFREALEASLIVGILYSFLTRQENRLLIKSLWCAVWVSLIASIGVAFLFTRLESVISITAYEKLFEAVLMFITAWILLKTIVRLAKWEYRVWTANHDTHAHTDYLSCTIHPQSQWFKKHNTKTIRQSLITAATHAIQSDTVHWWVFSLVFFAILRERFETVLLLNASQSMI
jgi:high-affinity Fe2+/Pb2+ permease